MAVKMVSSKTEDLAFGLVPALNLAEGGKDVKARQMGETLLLRLSMLLGKDSWLEMVEVVRAHLPSLSPPLLSPARLPLSEREPHLQE